MPKDLGFYFKICVHSDATAALGICRRWGLGKVRHLDVVYLWAQDKVLTGVVELAKVLGADKPADIMTKYTDKATLKKCYWRWPCIPSPGYKHMLHKQQVAAKLNGTLIDSALAFERWWDHAQKRSTTYDICSLVFIANLFFYSSPVRTSVWRSACRCVCCSGEHNF